LAASLVPGYNSASNLSEQNGGSTEDINGHGTHTAGTMAAIGNNSLGVVGCSWRCKIMPIRVTNNSGGSASFADLLEGAQWAVDHGARSINCSYSGVTNGSVQTTGAYIKAHGGEYCWAAGNDGSQLPSNTDWPDVTIVGASTQTDARASFSNFGIPIDVFAPGVSILSTYPTSSYAYSDGTSMAAPHATGSYGLLFSINQSFTPNQLETFLYTTCFDMGGGGNDNTYGWGRINLGAAAQMANSNNGSHVNPSAYRFVAGQYISGDVNSLGNGDDNWLRGHGSLGAYIAESPIILEVDMTSPSATASSLKLNLEAHNSQPMTIKLRLKRWSDNVWVEVDSRTYGTVDGAVQINVANPQNYVRSGDNFIQARAAVKLGVSGGSPTFDSFFDVFSCDITP
jgi:subtilisin family serine protease